MELEPSEQNTFIKETDKSKLLYAVSLAESIIQSNDSDKIKSDLDRVWKICGYSSKKKFDDLFKSFKGYSIYEHCRNSNPDCKC